MKKTFIYFAISFFYVFPYILQGQNNTAVNSNFTLQNVILPDTKPTEWTEIRERIKNRILNDWGTTPEAFEPRKNEYVVTEKYSKFGLQHMVVRYHVTENIWDKAIIVLPPDFSEKKTYKGFLAIHGSNLEKGGYQNTDPEKYPRRAYAYEMALKGFVAIAPDHFGFGDTLGTGGIAKQNQIIQDFYKEYPDWTLVGRQILGFMRALDVFDQLPYVEKDN